MKHSAFGLPETTIYVPRSDGARKLLGAIESAETLEQLSGDFGNFPREFGFDYASLVFLNEGNKRLLTRRVFTTLPESLRLKAFARASFRNDTVLEKIRDGKKLVLLQRQSTTSPTDDTEAPFTGGFSDSNGAAFLLEYPTGLRVATILNTEQHSPWASDRIKEHAYDLRAIATLYVDAFVYFTSVGRGSVNLLTEDESALLRSLATFDDPKLLRNQTFRYGSMKTIQTSIARKLGVKSVFQAVAVATKQGLFDNALIVASDIVHTEQALLDW